MLTEGVPSSLVDAVAGRPRDQILGGPDGVAWLRSLPRLVEEACARWSLSLDPAWVRHGECALVVPVVRAEGTPAALKVTWPHREASTEHLALRAWGGDGAVRLLAADPTSWTLLLERLEPDRSLRDVPVTSACETIGELLRRLDRPATAQFPRLAEVLTPLRAHPLLPRRLVERAQALTTDLLADAPSRLLHSDLHYDNVLASANGWVAIDPKPLAADPAYGVWPVLHNRWQEVTAATSVRRAVLYRLAVTCDAAELDTDRAAAWALVRSVHQAAWMATASPGADLTPHIAIAKAMEPE